MILPIISRESLRIEDTPLGKVRVDDLFDDVELGLFDFYEVNRMRYARAADIGANVGIHSLMMAVQGWNVTGYEADPLLCEVALRNVRGKAVIVNAAVSDGYGAVPFIRVLDNLTASHVKGAKSFYGPIETIDVPAIPADVVFRSVGFAKIDAEGSEVAILSRLSHPCDVMVEIHGSLNAASIYRMFHDKRGMWVQKNDWEPVRTVADMPTNHLEGALFIGDEAPFERAYP